MKGVAIVGKKGGTGKTTTAHLLALGSAWNDVPAYLMHTDDREPITVNGRPYGYYDARDLNTLGTLLKAVLNNDGLCIIDSGGNRPDFDKMVASSMDLVVIPVTADKEDVATALDHAAALEEAGAQNVRFLVTRFPSNKFRRAKVESRLEALPQKKIIGFLPNVDAVDGLRESDEPKFETPPSKVNSLARTTYHLVNEALIKLLTL